MSKVFLLPLLDGKKMESPNSIIVSSKCIGIMLSLPEEKMYIHICIDALVFVSLHVLYIFDL